MLLGSFGKRPHSSSALSLAQVPILAPKIDSAKILAPPSKQSPSFTELNLSTVLKKTIIFNNLN